MAACAIMTGPAKPAGNLFTGWHDPAGKFRIFRERLAIRLCLAVVRPKEAGTARAPPPKPKRIERAPAFVPGRDGR